MSMKITKVSYGRSITVGTFGRTSQGKIWFGWEAEVNEDNADSCMGVLKDTADLQELEERREHYERTSRGDRDERGR